jgi:glycosyltransferase involved in cell wall biosynthesis
LGYSLMPDSPLVSSIIATYNRGYIVCEAIDSILSQTYGNTEIIVVDDGSTDDTREKLRRYGDRIHVVSQNNSGPAAAWNAGIKASKGEIICFLGSDDLWLPTFVERQVSVLERGGPSVPCSISNAFTRWANGTETYSFDLACLRPEAEEGLWLNALDVLLTRFVMCGQMMAIRRKTLEKIGSFDGKLSYLEDYDVALRLSLEGNWGYIREPLVFYRQSTSGDSMSLQASSVDAKLAEYILLIRERVVAAMRSQRPPLRSRYMAGAIRKAKRDIWAARAKTSATSVKRQLVGLYGFLEHSREAVYRRSPFFPRMNTAPIPGPVTPKPSLSKG